MKKILASSLLIILFGMNAYAGGKGKIIFSNKPIEAANGESLSPVTINVGEKVYCQVYLPKAFASYTKMLAWGTRVYLNDQEFCNTNGNQYKNPEDAKTTTFGFVLNEDEKGNITDSDFNQKLKKLPVGTYTIKVEIFVEACNVKSFIANGEFTISKGEKTNAKIGKTFNDVKAKKSDPELEAKMLKWLNDQKEQLAGDVAKDRNYIAVKLVSDDWKIIRKQATGEITSHTIDAAVLVKDAAGKCQIWVCVFFQDYNGSGYKDSLRLNMFQKDNAKSVYQFVGDCDCE